jgi:hypothetical protein
MNCQYFFMGCPAVDLLVHFVRCDAVERRHAPGRNAHRLRPVTLEPAAEPENSPPRSICGTTPQSLRLGGEINRRQDAESAEQEPKARLPDHPSGQSALEFAKPQGLQRLKQMVYSSTTLDTPERMHGCCSFLIGEVIPPLTFAASQNGSDPDGKTEVLQRLCASAAEHSWA